MKIFIKNSEIGILSVILIFIFASIVFASSSVTDPSEIGVGARPLGMGMAFSGIADDGSAIYLNPAGLANFQSLKLNSMSGTILQDVQYLVVGAASPFTFGTLGVGYVNVGVSGIPVTTLTGGSTPEFSGKHTDYNAGLFFLSYGSKLDRFFNFSFASDVAVGASAKIFLQGFSGGGASLEGASGTGFDLDLGAQYKPVKWGTLGLNLVNCLPFDMGGKFVWPATATNDDIYEEAISMVVKLGGAVTVIGEDGLNQFDNHKVIVALDLDMYPSLQRPSVWHLGTEWWPTNILALRLGIDQQAGATESGIEIENNLTGGVGMKYQGFTFDYAYHQYGDLTENITHYFSFGYVGNEEVEKIKEKKEEIVQVIMPTKSIVKPKPVLVSFVDVPEGYWSKEAIEYLATIGVIGGYPDRTFRPENPITRAEFSTLLARAKGLETSDITKDPYPDLSADNWAAKFIDAATKVDLVSGYPDGTFKPNKSVSRAEGVVLVTRFDNVKRSNALTSYPFPDLPSSHWAAPSVYAAVEAGMLDFMNGNNFEPNEPLTRAEVAEMLSKTPWGRAKIRAFLENE